MVSPADRYSVLFGDRCGVIEISRSGNYVVSSSFGTSISEGTNSVGANGTTITFQIDQLTPQYKSLYWQIEPYTGSHGDFWEEFFSNKIGGEPADSFANSGFTSGLVTRKINPDSISEYDEQFAISFYLSNLDPSRGIAPVATARFNIIDDDPVRLTGGDEDNYFFGFNLNDALSGGGGHDYLSGGRGDDILTGGPGNDILDGGLGVDVARYEGPSTSAVWAKAGLSWVVSAGPEGVDTLIGVERLQFANRTVNLNAATDLNSDGTSDVLLQNGAGAVVSWSIDKGQYAGGGVITTGAAGFTVVGSGDFNADGTGDILLQNGGTVVAWTMQNGQYVSGNTITTGAMGYVVKGVGDFNGDGTDDIVLQNNGAVVVWLMKDGAYQSGNLLTSSLGPGFQVVGAGDFNGDGTSDILLQNGGTVVAWQMQNGVYQSGRTITDGAASFTVRGTGDFNGDGHTDIVLQNGGTVVDWIMKDGAYQSGNVLTTGAAGFTIRNTGDYNSDGVDDILLQSDDGSIVVDWIMQDGKYAYGNTITDTLQGFTIV